MYFGIAHVFQQRSLPVGFRELLNLLAELGLSPVRSEDTRIEAVDGVGDRYFVSEEELAESIASGRWTKFKATGPEGTPVGCSSEERGGWWWWRLVVGDLQQDRLPTIRGLVQWFEREAIRPVQIALVIDADGRTEERFDWSDFVIGAQVYRGEIPDVTGVRAGDVARLHGELREHTVRSCGDYVLIVSSSLEERYSGPFPSRDEMDRVLDEIKQRAPARDGEGESGDE